MIAPTALHKLAHPEGLNPLRSVEITFLPLPNSYTTCCLVTGEAATARAAAASKTIMVMR